MAENESLFEDMVDFDLGLPQTGNETPAEEQEKEEPSTEETSADDRVLALYDFLAETGLTEKAEDFKGTVEELDQVLQTVPTRLTQLFMESTGDAAASLIQYAVTLGKEATVEKLRDFFATTVEPAFTEVEVKDDTSAYNYLKSKLTGSKFFPTEARLETYLENLLESGELQTTAQKLAEEDKEAAKQRLAQEVEQIEQQKKEYAQVQQQLVAKVFEEIDNTQWAPTRKQAVKKAMDPAYIQKVNQAIQQSPVAIMQLADMYTYFDVKTGKFDFSAYQAQANSKEVEKTQKVLEKSQAQSLLDRMGKKSSAAASSGSLWDDLKPID